MQRISRSFAALRRLRMTLATALLLFASACCTPLAKLVPTATRIAPATSSYTPPAARFAVAEETRDWRDAARNRDVPARIYVPQNAGAKMPLVVFSHGIGEDRDSYVWLGRALAAGGYVAVHVTHAGTDKAVLKSGYWNLYKATKQKSNWVNRPLDVRFAIDRMLATRSDIDPNRIAVIGHSAGAFTALAIAGMQPPDAGATLADPRVKVAVAMSMPKMPPMNYDTISIPVLHMTGTCDTSLIYRTKAPDRRLPFESTHATRQYLVTFEHVRHESFSNAEDEHHAEMAEITAAFLEGWLRDDAAARAWFDGGGLASRPGLALERK